MSRSLPQDLGERLAAALDVSAFGVELTAERFRRENPADSDEEIAERLRQWLRSRPADGAGRPITLPRS